MGKFKHIFKAATSLLGLSSPKVPAAAMPPAAVVPAVAAPMLADNAGADVVVGTNDFDSTRIGAPSRRSGRRTVDVLGGLGLGGGLSI